VRRRPQAWHGTDRQVRGRLLARLRELHEPAPVESLVLDDVPADQWTRSLESLLSDGLAQRHPDGTVALPR
jgi:A/G-specific adenine glycosylase